MKRRWTARDTRGWLVAESTRRESIIALVRRLVKRARYGRVLSIRGPAREKDGA